MTSGLVARESEVQAERMKEALGVCGEVIINKLEQKASTEVDASAELERPEFQGLRGVFRGSFELAPPRLPSVRFAPNVKHWTRTEQKTEREDYWVEKRVWWKLWLGKSRVKETRSVVVTTTNEGITVAKLGDLLDGFNQSGGLAELGVFFGAWLGEGIANFDKTLERRLRDDVKIYRGTIEERGDQIERGAQTRIEGIGRHRLELRGMVGAIDDARNWRGICNG